MSIVCSPKVVFLHRLVCPAGGRMRDDEGAISRIDTCETVLKSCCVDVLRVDSSVQRYCIILTISELGGNVLSSASTCVFLCLFYGNARYD